MLSSRVSSFGWTTLLLLFDSKQFNAAFQPNQNLIWEFSLRFDLKKHIAKQWYWRNAGGRKYYQHFFSIVLQFRVDRFAIEIFIQIVNFVH